MVADILSQGIHLVIVDLFPPTPRDPQGIHKAIWDAFGDEPFDFLPDKPLTVVLYKGRGVRPDCLQTRRSRFRSPAYPGSTARTSAADPGAAHQPLAR
jgi:hypothetical protein